MVRRFALRSTCDHVRPRSSDARSPQKISVTSTNARFWLTKFERNELRDKVVRAQLLRLGWRVGVVWECGIRRSDNSNLVTSVKQWLSGSSNVFEFPASLTKTSQVILGMNGDQNEPIVVAWFIMNSIYWQISFRLAKSSYLAGKIPHNRRLWWVDGVDIAGVASSIIAIARAVAGRLVLLPIPLFDNRLFASDDFPKDSLRAAFVALSCRIGGGRAPAPTSKGITRRCCQSFRAATTSSGRCSSRRRARSPIRRASSG